MKLENIIRRAMEIGEIVAEATVEVGKVAMEKVSTGSEVVAKVAIEEFKEHAITTCHEAYSILEEEAKNFDWKGYELRVHDAPSPEVKANCKDNGSIIGLTVPMDKTVTFYVVQLTKVCNDLWFVPSRLIIRSFLKHENRHVQQFERMRELGGDEAVAKALFSEMFTLFYGTSNLEKDAFKYQVGMVQELDEVIAQYVR